ncbi:MAG: iron-only hydrogenase system regulator [Clostridia bacterium]|nr:iron-only hydrogenase system regulator [Clostridia bacterium]
MEQRVALIAIIIEKKDHVGRLNDLLHEYGDYVIGRMGLPYPKRGIQIISVAVDAPRDVINTLSGKLGRLDGITTKTVYSGLVSDD